MMKRSATAGLADPLLSQPAELPPYGLRPPTHGAPASSEDGCTELLIDLPPCTHAHHHDGRGQPHFHTNHHYTQSQMDAQMYELTQRLANDKRLNRRDKLTVAHLQHEISRQKALTQRECLMHDFERERMLRIDAEQRLQEMTLQSDTYRTTCEKLNQDYRNMDDMIQSLLHYKTKTEQLKQDKATLIANYENSIERGQNRISDLERENVQLLMDMRKLQDKYKQATTSPPSDKSSTSSTPQNNPQMTAQTSSSSGGKPQQLDMCKVLQEKIRQREAEHSSLMLENERQRQQYEKCLDDIANQVVNALLAQKGLREECLKLQDRVRDLEYQNQQLRVMIKSTANTDNLRPPRQATMGGKCQTMDQACSTDKLDDEEDPEEQERDSQKEKEGEGHTMQDRAGGGTGAMLERKPEGQSGTIFSEESLGSIHSMFSDQDPMHGDSFVCGETQLSTSNIWCGSDKSGSSPHLQKGDDTPTTPTSTPLHCAAATTCCVAGVSCCATTTTLPLSASSSSVVMCAHTTITHATTAHSSPCRSSSMSYSPACSAQRLVVSPCSSNSSITHHFTSMELPAQQTGLMQPARAIRQAMRDTTTSSSRASSLTSPGERLLQLSDSFPEKLMILNSPDLLSPVDGYFEFDSDTETDCDDNDDVVMQSNLSLNEILEKQFSASNTPKDESFDDHLPKFELVKSDYKKRSPCSSIPRLSKRTSAIEAKRSTLEHSNGWVPSDDMSEAPMRYHNHRHHHHHHHHHHQKVSLPNHMTPRNCLIQRPTSLELLSSNSKLTHVTDFLNDSSSSNSDMTSSRTGQLTVQVRHLKGHCSRSRSASSSGAQRRSKNSTQISPTVYCHNKQQRLSLADSGKLSEIDGNSTQKSIDHSGSSAGGQSYAFSSSSHSPQSLSPPTQPMSSETSVSYGSPPIDYSEAARCSNGPTSSKHQVRSDNTGDNINRNLMSSSSPDSAMQQSFTSSSDSSDHGLAGASNAVSVPVQESVLPEGQKQIRDDGYASNSTTSVSLNDIRHTAATLRHSAELSQLVEHIETVQQESTDKLPPVQNKLLQQCSDDLAGSTSSVESNKIGSVKDITAYFEGKFETQQIKIEPSPEIRMPPKVLPKPAIIPSDKGLIELCEEVTDRRCTITKSYSDSYLCVHHRSVVTDSMTSDDYLMMDTHRWFSDGFLLHMDEYDTTEEALRGMLEALQQDCMKLKELFAKRPSLEMDRSLTNVRQDPRQVDYDINWMSFSESDTDESDEDVEPIDDEFYHPVTSSSGHRVVYERPTMHNQSNGYHDSSESPPVLSPYYDASDDTSPEPPDAPAGTHRGTSNGHSHQRPASPGHPVTNGHVLHDSTDGQGKKHHMLKPRVDLLTSPVSPGVMCPVANGCLPPAVTSPTSPGATHTTNHEPALGRRLKKPYDHLVKESKRYDPAGRAGAAPGVRPSQIPKPVGQAPALHPKRRADMLDELVGCNPVSFHLANPHKLSPTSNGHLDQTRL